MWREIQTSQADLIAGVYISTYSVIICYGIVTTSGGKVTNFLMAPKLFH